MLALLWVSACAADPPLGPPPEFVRAQGTWAPEELNRDLIGCLDVAHRDAMDRYAAVGAPARVLQRTLREDTSTCMQEKGWETR